MVGIAFGCFSLGSVAGSLLAGRTHWPFGRALVSVYVLDALFWLPIIWTHTLPVPVGAIVGRVFGLIRLLVLVGMVPASILGGLVADHWGPRAVMGLSGGLFLLLALNLAGSRALLSDRR
ncbi:MAG: hypothetical protein ABSH03_03435 [Candidatus Lustribacter sp.]|jgi:hypothetical protein